MHAQYNLDCDLFFQLNCLFFVFYRDGNDIFSVNALHFHNLNTFCSGGSDGIVYIWDKDVRHRLANFEVFKRQCPVTDTKFNPMVRK